MMLLLARQDNQLKIINHGDSLIKKADLSTDNAPIYYFSLNKHFSLFCASPASTAKNCIDTRDRSSYTPGAQKQRPVHL